MRARDGKASQRSCRELLHRSERTLDGSSFAFSTLDLSRRGLQVLAVDADASLRATPPPPAGQVEPEPHAALDPLPASPFTPAAEEQDCALFGGLAKFRHVRFLDVSRNRLRELTPACGMPSLLAISAAGNALTGLPAPDALRRLRWLQSLDVSFNLLHRLDGIPARREAVAAYFAARAAARTAAAAHDDGGGDRDDSDNGSEAIGSAESGDPSGPSRLLDAHPAGPVAGAWLREINLNGNALETLSGLGAGVGPRGAAWWQASPGSGSGSSSGSALAPPNPRLARVDAQANRIGPSVSGIGLCPSLEELYLSRNRVRSLGGLFGCAGLRALHVGRNLIDSLRALVDPTDASHRREWGWGWGEAVAGEAAEEEEADADREDSGFAAGAGSEGEAEATERARAAAEEEAAEAFSLPDDRSVARALVTGGGLPRDALPAAGQPLPPVLTLISPSRLGSMPLAALLDHRRRLLAAVLDDSARAVSAGPHEEPAAGAAGAARAAGGGDEADEETAGGGAGAVLPAAPGAGLPLQGPDAAAVAAACERVLAACADAADRCAAASDASGAALALTPPSAHAAALALASPAASSLPRLERLDLSNNEGLTSLAELVWLRALPALRSLDLRGCPVSEEGEGMPLEALVWVGPHLAEVNGQAVTEVHRRAAARERGRREKERRAWRRARAAEFAEAAAEAKAERERAAAEAAARGEDEAEEDDA